MEGRNNGNWFDSSEGIVDTFYITSDIIGLIFVGINIKESKKL